MSTKTPCKPSKVAAKWEDFERNVMADHSQKEREIAKGAFYAGVLSLHHVTLAIASGAGDRAQHSQELATEFDHVDAVIDELFHTGIEERH